MASHESTPQSVREAPSLSSILISPQHGLTRQERRHGVAFLPGLPDGLRAAYYGAIREAGANTPFTGKVSDAFSDRSLRLTLRRGQRHRRLEAVRQAGVEPGDVRQVVDLAEALASEDWTGRGA